MQQHILSLPAPGTISRYADFDGSSDSLFLAQLAQQAKPITIITANALDAQRLLEEIPYFSSELKTHLLPDWETLPYDSFSPHHDLVSERLATLYQVMIGACDVLIVPLTTALYRMLPREIYRENRYARLHRVEIHAPEASGFR